jgi:hypothetical protein
LSQGNTAPIYNTDNCQVQTPQQRRANAKFAKAEEDKRGKPVQEKVKRSVAGKSPISAGWLILLAVIIIGGIFVELLRMWF